MNYPENIIKKPDSCTNSKCEAYNEPHFALVLTHFFSPTHTKHSLQVYFLFVNASYLQISERKW